MDLRPRRPQTPSIEKPPTTVTDSSQLSSMFTVSLHQHDQMAAKKPIGSSLLEGASSNGFQKEMEEHTHGQFHVQEHGQNGHEHEHEYHGHNNEYQNGHVHNHSDLHHHYHDETNHMHDHGQYGHFHTNEPQNHEHSHDDHSHSRAHHNHTHSHQEHSYYSSPPYIPPLPSLSQIFDSLTPNQKTLFTWAVIHFLTGLMVWWIGQSGESLALTGFGYILIFDSFGVLVAFVSTIVSTSREFKASSLKRPFGAQRIEIIFAFGSTIYLLFTALYVSKESAEHLMLEEAAEYAGHPDGVRHESTGTGAVFAIFCGVAATLVSSIAYRNHRNFASLLRARSSTTGLSYSTLYPVQPSPLTLILNNPFTIVTLASAMLSFISIIMGDSIFAHYGMADKIVAFMESFAMFYLGIPTAIALSKVLIQTSPDGIDHLWEGRLREIVASMPEVTEVGEVHLWQNTWGILVGTMEVRIREEANEQAVLGGVLARLEGIIGVKGSEGGGGEVTVQVLKMQ